MPHRDGGPAFPHVCDFGPHDREVCPGMSLRQHYAGLAMQAVAGAILGDLAAGMDFVAAAENFVAEAKKKGHSSFATAVAAMAFSIADAMLEESEKEPNNGQR